MNPLDYIKQDALACEWDPAPFLLFSGEVEPLVYYSHLFPAVAVAILAIVVLFRSSSRLTARLFFIISILFSTFAIFDLILWATEKPSLIMFLWSMLTYIEPLIYAATLYFVLAFARQADISIWSKLIAGTLLLPIIVLGPTPLNLAGFDYTNCWRLAVEGPLLYYVYILEIVFVAWMIVGTVTSIRNTTDVARRKTLRFLLMGALLFLLAFSSGNIFGTLLQGVMGEGAWIIGQYGFFGMPIFLGFIMFLMVRYELFAARVVYAEVIMLAMFTALVSLLFVPDKATMLPILMLTIGLFAVLGFILVLGIRNDIKQRQEIEHLAERLEKANRRLKVLDKMKSEFVSIASHQLRSPLTAIRGYASMILEGSYGQIPDKAKEALERISDSSKHMVNSVEDYLNVSRIESGNMKYEMSDFNFKSEAEHVIDELRQVAMKRGLLLTFRSDISGSGIVNADIGKVRQALHNLINNSIKYTEKGSIIVTIGEHLEKKKIWAAISDTGVGMSPDTQAALFEKFSRAKDANKVNTSGTGLGLFVAKQMIEHMGGTITAESDGEGKGSTFTLTLPLQQ